MSAALSDHTTPAKPMDNGAFNINSSTSAEETAAKQGRMKYSILAILESSVQWDQSLAVQ